MEIKRVGNTVYINGLEPVHGDPIKWLGSIDLSMWQGGSKKRIYVSGRWATGAKTPTKVGWYDVKEETITPQSYYFNQTQAVVNALELVGIDAWDLEKFFQ